jgi:hypothetical protein
MFLPNKNGNGMVGILWNTHWITGVELTRDILPSYNVGFTVADICHYEIQHTLALLVKVNVSPN